MATQEAHKRDLNVDAILAGDRKAFEHMVEKETPRLFRVVRRIVDDDDEAMSVVQETFLQAYKSLDAFRGDSKLTTWLYGIGINQARAARRKARRTSSLDDLDIERMQPSFNRGMFAEQVSPWSPDKVAEVSDVRRIVHEGIRRLPPDYRTVVELRDIQEYSTRETAQMLDLSEGAVRVRLHRARQALRELLDGELR